MKNQWDLNHLYPATTPIPGNVEACLEELGITVQRITWDEAWALCPEHEEGYEEGKPARNWSVMLEDKVTDEGQVVHAGTHSCFSCGFSGSFVSLVVKVLGLDIDGASLWVRNRGGIERAKKLISQRENPREAPKPVAINEAQLALFTVPPARSLQDRLINVASASYYGILWDSSRSMFILPVRDPDTGRLLGYQEKAKGHFKNVPEGLVKGKTLFGYQEFRTNDAAILVESPLDVARLHTVGITGGLSSYGAGVTNVQMQLIQTVTDTVIIGLDSDRAGTDWSQKLYKRWKNKGLTIRFLTYEHTTAKDVGEMTAAEIKYAVDHAIPGALIKW